MKLRGGEYTCGVGSEHLLSFTVKLRASRMVAGYIRPQTGDAHPH